VARLLMAHAGASSRGSLGGLRHGCWGDGRPWAHDAFCIMVYVHTSLFTNNVR